MKSIYALAKEYGGLATTAINDLEDQYKKNLEFDLGRKLTDEEEDMFTEGFWNGIL